MDLGVKVFPLHDMCAFMKKSADRSLYSQYPQEKITLSV
jgi:hypothetical protein